MNPDDRQMPSASPRRTLTDVAIITLVLALLVSVRASAPSDLHAYAQVWQMGAAVDVLEGDSHPLLPRTQASSPYRKPPLYPYLAAAAIRLTGRTDDFVFRLPTVLAAVATALLVYSLARRWYGRYAALPAACLWVTMQHMGRLAYLATTDMLLTLWITAALVCADRLLPHPSPRPRLWAVGFWAAMVLAALSKGWGVVNLVVVGLFVALSAPAVMRSASDAGSGPLRRVLHRWRRAARELRLGWGLPAMAVVLAVVLGTKLVVGGQEFREVFHFEIVQRLTGHGVRPGRAPVVPPVVQLVYYTLPASVFAAGALLLRMPRPGLLRRLGGGRARRLIAGGRIWVRRCFRRSSPTLLPLCWILAVVVPFSLARGFRPDYLLPCYAAVALMGGWAVSRLERLARVTGRLGSAVRHAFASVPLIAAVLVFLTPWVYVLHGLLPSALAELVPMPAYVAPLTPVVAVGCSLMALVCIRLVVRASLRWRLRQVAALSVAIMLPLWFVYGHFVDRYAITGDGETMVRFARDAPAVVGEEPFIVYQVQRLAVEPLLGRFGERVHPAIDGPPLPSTADEAAERVVAQINASSAPLMFVSDTGLLELGAARADAGGEFAVSLPGGRRRFEIRPRDLGQVLLTSRPVEDRNWGRIYLIRLDRPVSPSGEPVSVGYAEGAH